MRVLVTRPAAAAAQTAERLRALGHEAVIAPLLETVFLDGPVSGLQRAQALLFTSANGVQAFARRYDERFRPVFAVGDKTAEAAREAGFTAVESAGGDADALAALIAQRLTPEKGPLIFPRGRQIAGKLSQTLGKAGFAVHAGVVYEARATETLPSALRTCLEEDSLGAALFFSPRTAQAFVRLLEKEGLAGRTASLEALCLSQKVAECLSPLRWKAVRVAQTPNQAALLDLL